VSPWEESTNRFDESHRVLQVEASPKEWRDGTCCVREGIDREGSGEESGDREGSEVSFTCRGIDPLGGCRGVHVRGTLPVGAKSQNAEIEASQQDGQRLELRRTCDFRWSNTVSEAQLILKFCRSVAEDSMSPVFRITQRVS